MYLLEVTGVMRREGLDFIVIPFGHNLHLVLLLSHVS